MIFHAVSEFEDLQIFMYELYYLTYILLNIQLLNHRSLAIFVVLQSLDNKYLKTIANY